jgi:hypothetical protein
LTTDVATLAYVYAVTWAQTPVPDDTDAIVHRDLAAVTTVAESRSVRARRSDLLRHAEVARCVFEHGTVVPLQFGAVVEDVVEELLDPLHDELVQLLREFEGLAEMTLRAHYREDAVLHSLLAEDPRLERLRLTGPPVQLGEAVARALAARRDADSAAIIRALRPYARDLAVDELRNEYEVFRGAFLIPKRDLERADAAVEALAAAHAPVLACTYTGPLPPHHFVRLGGS